MVGAAYSFVKLVVEILRFQRFTLVHDSGSSDRSVDWFYPAC